MRPWPRSLFARTALLVVLLIIVSQTGWIVITRTLVALYSHGEHLHPIADLATVVDRELVRLPPSRRWPEAQFLIRRTGVQITRRLLSTASLEKFPPSNPLYRSLTARLGPTTRLFKDPRTHRFWIALPMKGRAPPYWLVVPQSAFWRTLPYTTTLGLIFGILVAVVGAILVSRRLSRHFQLITKTVEAIGRGGTPPPLPVRGSTELRKMSAGINRMIDDLRVRSADHRMILAGISHDLRTPLTRLQLALALSEDRLETDLATGMIQDLEDMDRIIARFLEYARHGREEEPVAVDLTQRVMEVVERYRRAGSTIACELPRSAMLVARPQALTRLITNLIDNAVRHGRVDVRVRVEEIQEGWMLSVEDGGEGLDPDWAMRIVTTEPHGPVTGEAVGRGLGLATVGRIARLHEAKVSVERLPEGGTRISVRFSRGSLPDRNMSG